MDDSQNFFKEFEPRLEKNNVLPTNSHSNRKRNRSNMMNPDFQTHDGNFSTIGSGLIKSTQESRNTNSGLFIS